MIKIVSSWESILGLTIFAFFLFVFIALSATFVVFAISAKKGLRRQSVYQAILLLLVSLWMGIIMVPSFFEFTKVNVSPDGTWILKNGWGITLGKLPKEMSRRVEVYQKQVTWYGSSYRRYKAANIYVITDKNIYSSWTILPDQAEELSGRFQDLIEIQNIPSSQNQHIPYLVEKRLQQIKFAIYGMFIVVVIVPFVLPKKKENERSSKLS